MSLLTCPNAPCPATFDPSALAPGAAVTCPACGSRFRVGRANADPANRPAAPPPRVSFLSVFVLVAVVTIGIVLILYSVARRRGPAPVAEKEIRFAEQNVALTPPDAPWARDRDAEAALKMNLGFYTRTGPDAGFAFAAQTFGDRDARPSEFRSFLDERLRRLCDTLQQSPTPGATWFGREAMKIEFRGTIKGHAVVAGEAWAVPVKGFAYFFFAWATERDAPSLAATFADARGRMRLLSPRNEWAESKPPGTVFQSATHPYTVFDSDGLWAVPRGSRPTDEDPLADLWIHVEIKPRGRAGDAAARADAYAFLVPASSDPLAAAVKYVTSRPSRNPERHAAFQFDVLKDPITGDEPLGGPPANPQPVTRLKMTHPDNPDVSRLIVVAALEIPGSVVAVEATCLWRDREVFERRLVNLAGSVAAKK